MSYRRLNYTEPAVLRGIWAAVLLLAGSVGLTVSTAVDAQVGVVIGIVGTLGPLVQALLTRRVVSPAVQAPDERVTDTENPPPAGVEQGDLPQTPGSAFGA